MDLFSYMGAEHYRGVVSGKYRGATTGHRQVKHAFKSPWYHANVNAWRIPQDVDLCQGSTFVETLVLLPRETETVPGNESRNDIVPLHYVRQQTRLTKEANVMRFELCESSVTHKTSPGNTACITDG